MRKVLTFRRERCLGCWSCELACSAAHTRRRLTIALGASGIEALRCEQCEEPLCVFSCKSGALRRETGGRVLLDESRCVGCYMCLMVCPWGIRPDPATGRVVRCDVCSDREIPSCVAACPTGALGAQPEPVRAVESAFSGHVVVVGSSAAGIAACEAAREHAPACSITLVTADASLYSRPLLSYALAGRTQKMDWQAPDGVRVVRGAKAASVQPGTLVLGDGTELAFDRLIVATGARAAALSIPGAVHTLRDLADLEAIDRLAAPGRHAVVLGGGNVGLQVCEALLERGLEVTVVVKSPHLLSQMVDAEVGRHVAELFARHGLRLRTGRDAVQIGEGVRLDNGELLAADLVVAGKGIEPNVEWLRGSGVRIGRGIVVDRCGRTSVENIFAAGDCAEVDSTVSGIWPVAYEMGRAAGSTAVGVERACAGALRMNASRFFGEPVISIGEVRAERLPGASSEVLANREGVYRKLVYHQGRLAGALLYGDISGAGSFYRLYREQQGVN